jgi:DNA-binding protein HU-beta
VGLSAAKPLAKRTKSGVNPSVVAPSGGRKSETTHMTTQAELIAAVAKDAGVSQADAGRVLTAMVDNIHKSLKSGGDVRISNLGVFDTAARAAREGRNPATGATIKIAASKAVRFRVSKPLKDAVNK